MAFLDSSATGQGFSMLGEATAFVASVDVQVVWPRTGDRIGYAELTISVSNTGGGNSDIEIEVSTSSTFAGSPVWSTTLTNRANGSHVAVATGLTNGIVYYWRARAANTGTTGWGPWTGSPVVTLTPRTVTASAASSTAGAGFEASKAFDGDAGTYWLVTPSPTMPQWIEGTLASPAVVTMFSLTMRNVDPEHRCPRDFTIEGWNGASWDVLATYFVDVGWFASLTGTFSFANTTSYSRYRVHITTSNGDNNIGITEFALLESTVGTPTPFWFVVDPGAARATTYLTQNVGTSNELVAHAAEYVTQNVGLENTVVALATEYVTQNVGLEVVLIPDAIEYLSEGDVSENTPIPHLWFLRPDSGRPLDGVDVVCFGVGDLQSTYEGEVQIKALTDPDWTTIGVASWQTFPPTDDAYTDDRTLDPIANLIDMQHTVIGIVIPADAIPPGYQVRLRTDGP